jgi:phosphatidylserine synthase
MLLFLIALILAAAGIGVYAHYNTGVQDITLRSYHFTGVPDWGPAAVVAGAVLFVFLIQAVYTSIRIRVLRRRARGRIPVGSTSPVQAGSR